MSFFPDLSFLKFKPHMIEGLDELGQLYVLAEMVLWHEGGAACNDDEMVELHTLAQRVLEQCIKNRAKYPSVKLPGIPKVGPFWSHEARTVAEPVFCPALALGVEDSYQTIRDKIVVFTSLKPLYPYERLKWRERLPSRIKTWSHRGVGETKYCGWDLPYRKPEPEVETESEGGNICEIPLQRRVA